MDRGKWELSCVVIFIGVWITQCAASNCALEETTVRRLKILDAGLITMEDAAGIPSTRCVEKQFNCFNDNLVYMLIQSHAILNRFKDAFCKNRDTTECHVIRHRLDLLQQSIVIEIAKRYADPPIVCLCLLEEISNEPSKNAANDLLWMQDLFEHMKRGHNYESHDYGDIDCSDVENKT